MFLIFILIYSYSYQFYSNIITRKLKTMIVKNATNIYKTNTFKHLLFFMVIV